MDQMSFEIHFVTSMEDTILVYFSNSMDSFVDRALSVLRILLRDSISFYTTHHVNFPMAVSRIGPTSMKTTVKSPTSASVSS